MQFSLRFKIIGVNKFGGEQGVFREELSLGQVAMPKEHLAQEEQTNRNSNGIVAARGQAVGIIR
jgi:hypothetical protein